MEQNLNIMNPPYNEPISSVPWNFVYSVTEVPLLKVLQVIKLLHSLQYLQIDGDH